MENLEKPDGFVGGASQAYYQLVQAYYIKKPPSQSNQ